MGKTFNFNLNPTPPLQASIAPQTWLGTRCRRSRCHPTKSPPFFEEKVTGGWSRPQVSFGKVPGKKKKHGKNAIFGHKNIAYQKGKISKCHVSEYDFHVGEGPCVKFPRHHLSQFHFNRRLVFLFSAFLYHLQLDRSETNFGKRIKIMEKLGISKNSGTPKWMVYNGKPY